MYKCNTVGIKLHFALNIGKTIQRISKKGMPLYASVEKKILHLRKGIIMPFEKMSFRILEKRTRYSVF